MLETLFANLSKSVWNRLKGGLEHGISQGEESITDDILLQIAEKKNRGIKIIKTPKQHESKQGTDWEWWIGSHRDGWFRYAIQAKKIRSRDGYYPTLNSIVNQKIEKKFEIKIKESQLNILKRYAKTNNAIPIYSLYNYVDRPKNQLKEYWNCNLPYNKKQLGWTYTSLAVIEDALSNNPTGKKRFFHHIHKQDETFPISCLTSNLRKELEKGRGYYPILPNLEEYWADKKITKVEEPAVSYHDVQYFNSREHLYHQKKIYDEELGLYPRRITVIDIDRYLYEL